MIWLLNEKNISPKFLKIRKRIIDIDCDTTNANKTLRAHKNISKRFKKIIFSPRKISLKLFDSCDSSLTIRRETGGLHRIGRTRPSIHPLTWRGGVLDNSALHVRIFISICIMLPEFQIPFCFPMEHRLAGPLMKQGRTALKAAKTNSSPPT